MTTEKKQLPIGCADRYRAVDTLARHLHLTFINGNRKDLVNELVELEPKAALAVLANIMAGASRDTRSSLKRFLMEVA